ncbi:hypothetical protein ACFYV7_16645 [Nocardia suismassiliense]|uniref:Uncharacterized protein n=1 Tax=Nocardia suismassiliense TaxID=2077092 RepID=A0ABW6QTF9_9NOCA
MSTDKAVVADRVPAEGPADSAWLGEFVQRTADVLPVRLPESRKPSAKPR